MYRLVNRTTQPAHPHGSRSQTLKEATRRSFTLIELVGVIVVLAILIAVAMPRYFDHRNRAIESADVGAMAGITTALKLAFAHNRMIEAPASQWVDEVSDIPAIMNHGVLPEGVSTSAGKLVDQRGNVYSLTAETAHSAATITMD